MPGVGDAALDDVELQGVLRVTAADAEGQVGDDLEVDVAEHREGLLDGVFLAVVPVDAVNHVGGGGQRGPEAHLIGERVVRRGDRHFRLQRGARSVDAGGPADAGIRVVAVEAQLVGGQALLGDRVLIGLRLHARDDREQPVRAQRGAVVDVGRVVDRVHLAVQIRAHRGHGHRIEIGGDLHGRQDEAVALRLGERRVAGEVASVRISHAERARIDRRGQRDGRRADGVERRAVVLLDVLIVEAGLDVQPVVRREVQGAAEDRRVGRVAVGLAVVRILPALTVDPAAFFALQEADAEAQLAFDDRAADGHAGFVARIAVIDDAGPGASIDAVVGQARGRRDEADGAALRARAEQGALRTAQHFDALEVEDVGHGRAGVVDRGVTGLDRGVVDVHRCRGRAGRRFDAADGDPLGTILRNVHARGLQRDVADVADALGVQSFLAIGADADRRLAQLHRLLGGGDDDLVDLRRLVGRRDVRPGEGRGRTGHAHQQATASRNLHPHDLLSPSNEPSARRYGSRGSRSRPLFCVA